MTTTTRAGHRLATPAVLVVAGGALAVATWIGDEPGLAIGLAVFYAVAALVAYVWSGRDTDAAALLRAGGDERQRGLDREAMALAALAMVYTAIGGAIVSAAVNGGDIGAFGLIAAVGGVSYVVAVVVLRRRG